MRIVLLILTNLAVMLVLGVVLVVLQATGMMPTGRYGYYLVYSLVFGFGGAFISLLISKPMAKWSTRARVIDAPSSETEAWLVETVRQHAQRAQIGMPEVAVFDSPDPNAFATGATKNSSLVAVSTGLLRSMDRREISAVLGHEIAHVANGDMVTMTLLQGVLNTFVYFFARVIGSLVDGALSGNRERGRGNGIGYFITVMLAQMVLGLLASMIAMWFSRQREYRADEGGAALTSTDDMASALAALKRMHPASSLPKNLAAFGVHGGGLRSLLSSHPPIEERIRHLQELGSRGPDSAIPSAR
ncbi:MAG: protease HtpX [Polyangiales bacterium]|nr:protease HtpX [Myxococcales bacterium]